MKRANGTGNITKLAGNRRKPWAVRVSYWDIVDGGRVRRRKIIGTFKTRREAQNQINGLLLGFDPSARQEAFKGLLLRDCVVSALDRLDEVVADNTSRAYRTAAKALAPFYGLPIAGISGEKWQEFFDGLARDHSRSYVLHALVVLRHAIKVAIRRCAMQSDPTAGLQFGKRLKKPKARGVFSHAEIARLWSLASAGNKKAITVLLMIYTGLRVAEFVAVRPADYVDGCLTVRSSKTAAGVRVVPVADCIRDFVSDRLQSCGCLTLRPVGTWSVQALFRSFMAQLGWEHVPHECRHTFATLLDEARLPDGHLVDLVVVKVLLGHRVSDLTKGIYTHENRDRLIEAANALPVAW